MSYYYAIDYFILIINTLHVYSVMLLQYILIAMELKQKTKTVIEEQLESEKNNTECLKLISSLQKK